MTVVAARASDRIQRRITAAEFAFLRAVLQGMSLRDAADRFLSPGFDLRLVRAELQRLRTELLVAARKAHAYGDARALQLDLAQLPISSAQAMHKQGPTLEVFRTQVDPGGDFYSETELIELYREQYPPAPVSRRAGRVVRLRDRQRRALDAMERVLVQPPAPADPPSAWLEERIARRLEAVGLVTLEKLAAWINQKGSSWYRPIPKVGAVAAAQVVAWLERNTAQTGLSLKPNARVSRDQLVQAWRSQAKPEARIVPLERLAVPAELDGSRGVNRVAGSVHLEAPNDYAALQSWLMAAAGGNPHTLSAYRREAERLLLWAIFERRRPMSSLSVDDAIAYRAFLANPLPAERWVGPRNVMRLSPSWRPFAGPLSAKSVAYGIVVVGSMFEWLVRQRYLALNVFAALPREAPRPAAADADPNRLRADAGRFFTEAQWSVLREQLRELGESEHALRIRFLVPLAYATGLRRAELLDARIGRLQASLAHDAQGQPRRYVQLNVLGKGGRVRAVPFVPALQARLDAYMAARGLPGWEACQEHGLHGVRLLAGVRTDSLDDVSLNPSTIHRDLKAVFARTAETLRARRLVLEAESFERASAHWLRHTFGRHAMKSMAPNIVQAVLGHVSLATTTIYSSAGAEQAYADVERFMEKIL